MQVGLQPLLNAGLRAARAASDRLTDLAMQLAPADTSPATVRVAVNAGVILLLLGFVRSVLSVRAGPSAACLSAGLRNPGCGVALCASPAMARRARWRPRPQFFLTLGTVIFGAYVATKFFGVDLPGVGGGPSGSSSRPSGCRLL